MIENYNNDEFDYYLVYDLISDICTRFDRISFNAAKQVMNLKIDGGMPERIIFDVLLSDLFQLPKTSSFEGYYRLVARVMRRRLPHQALNLMLK